MSLHSSYQYDSQVGTRKMLPDISGTECWCGWKVVKHMWSEIERRKASSRRYNSITKMNRGWEEKMVKIIRKENRIQAECNWQITFCQEYHCVKILYCWLKCLKQEPLCHQIFLLMDRLFLASTNSNDAQYGWFVEKYNMVVWQKKPGLYFSFIVLFHFLFVDFIFFFIVFCSFFFLFVSFYFWLFLVSLLAFIQLPKFFISIIFTSIFSNFSTLFIFFLSLFFYQNLPKFIFLIFFQHSILLTFHLSFIFCFIGSFLHFCKSFFIYFFPSSYLSFISFFLL